MIIGIGMLVLAIAAFSIFIVLAATNNLVKDTSTLARDVLSFVTIGVLVTCMMAGTVGGLSYVYQW